MQSNQLRGWLVVLLGVFGFFGWASLYPIEQGMPGTGFLISKGARIQVVSPTTGLLVKLHRRAGDTVNQGEILFEFDTLLLESKLSNLQEVILGLEKVNTSLKLGINAKKLQLSALQSEYRAAHDLIKSEFSNDSGEIDFIGAQSSANAAKSVIDGKIRKLIELRSQYDSSLKLFKSEFISASALATSQVQVSQAEVELLEFKAQVEQKKHRLESELSLVESEISELNARREQNYHRINELKESINSVKHEIALAKVSSPIAGKIMNTAIKSPGVNIVTGALIMEIVSDSEPLVIEARIPVEYATKAHVGMAVDVMFPTLPGSSTARMKGKLEYLSADRVIDSQTNQIYLEAQVSLIDEAGMNKLSLRPGLPVTLLIRTGPRTLLSYITRPFTERLNRGLQ